MTFKPYFAATLVTLLSTTLTLSACSQTPDTAMMAAAETEALPPAIYVAIVRNNAGERIGTAEITDYGDDGVKMSVKAAGIPEGPHGMHFHVKASCIAPNFKSAGGHINAMGMEHGLKNPNGPDNADMPNAVADANNTLNLKVTNDRVSLNGTDNLPALLDADGSALVIHANADDQMTQPIGGAGARIACAEFKK